VEERLRQIVTEAASRPEVREAVLAVYADVQREIDVRRPLCVISGKCCRFEEYGHRLYVTTLELATFIRDLKAPMPSDWDGTGCRFQVNKLCSVHTIRPFGCRLFFCDPTATEWQNELYERFHARLKRLHESLEVPYAYVEWRQALRALLGPQPVDSRDNV
jgi:Fe-S-cluster containining protein